MQPNQEAYKDGVLRFLSDTANISAAVATVDEAGLPYNAIVYFYADEELNFYFLTPYDTNKHKNLLKDFNLALAVGGGQQYTTIQVRGTASLLEKGSEEENTALAQLKNRLLDAAVTWPIYQLSDYDDNTLAVFKVVPTTLQYLNLEKDNGLPVTQEGIVTVI